jgi:Secretion system C-terminal sorting domain
MSKLFFFIAFIFGTALQAQQSFFVDGRRYGQCLIAGSNVYNTSVRVAYDSTISSFTYKVLLDVQTGAFAGMARESNDSIYFRDVVTQTDFLYYNFNLAQGDTTFFHGWMIADSVVNITLLNGQQSKYVRLHAINSGSTYEWIYGVGNIREGITQQLPWPDGPALPSFVCARDSSQLLWVTSSSVYAAYCDTLAGIIQPEESKENVELYPNPVLDYLNLESQQVSIARVEIIDNCGKIVLQYCLSNGRVKLDVSPLPAGLYFVKATSREGDLISMEKLIKL